MNAIKSSRITVWIAFIFLLSLTIYILLVGGSLVLKHYIHWSSKNIEATETQKTISTRKSQEDEVQAKQAFSEGYAPIANPAYIEIYPEINNLAQHYAVAPLGAQPNKNVYYCNEGYGTVKYTTDRFGYRNDDSLWDKNIDLLLIGDSFVHGACVGQKETISGNLLGAGYKTLNLGAGGSNPMIYAAQVKVFAPQVKPKYLVLFFYANDNNEGDQNSIFYRHHILGRDEYFQIIDKKISLSSQLKDYYRDLNKLLPKMHEANLFVASNNDILGKAKPYLLLLPIREQVKILLKRYFPPNPPEFSTKIAIDALIKTCIEINCTPIVAYIPNSNYWDPDPRALNYSNFIKSYSLYKHVRYYDSTLDLQRMPNESAYALKGPHLSPEGYKRVSEGILDLIRN